MSVKHIVLLNILFCLMCFPLLGQPPVAQESRAIFTFVYDGPNEIYVDSNCVGILDWGHPDNPEVIYNAPPGGFLVGFNLRFISGGYNIGDTIPAGTTVTIRYRAYDNQGNDQNFSFTIDFIDSIAPKFDPGTLPPDVTLSCADDLTPADPLANDNCTDSAGISYSIMQTATVNECRGGSFQRIFTATDEYGNSSSYAQNVTVEKDTIPPVFTILPEPDTAYCDNAAAEFQTWIIEQLARLEGTDNSCNRVFFGYDTTGTQNIEQKCGPVDVTFIAIDQCGNEATARSTFTVLDTLPPVLISEAMDASASCDQSGNSDIFQQWLQDHGGMEVQDDCSIKWSTDPPDIDISEACNTTIQVTFIASDGCDRTVSSTASFTLTDTTAPVIQNPASNLISACGNQDYVIPAGNWLRNAGNAVFEDFCYADTNLILSYVISGDTLSYNQAIDVFIQNAESGCEDSVVVGGIAYDNVLGMMEVTFLVSDPCGNTSDAGTRSIVLIDLLPPQYTSDAIDTIVQCGPIDSIEAVFRAWYNNRAGMDASDDCGAIVYSADLTESQAWQVLLDSIAMSCGQTGAVELRFTAQDLCGNTAMGDQIASFTIIDTTPPSLESPVLNQFKFCSAENKDSLSIWLESFGYATYAEECGGIILDSVVWSANDGQQATLIPGQSGYPITDSLGCTFTLDATFYVVDECGNTVVTNGFYRLIDGEPPTFVGVEDSINANCGEDVLLTLNEVVDNCTDQLSLIYLDDTVRSMDPLDCSYYNFTIRRVYTATDFCGNSSQLTQFINIEDTEAPEFIRPADVTVQCDQQDSLAITGYPVDTLDACGSPVSISYRDSVPALACSYTVLRTWTAQDLCGNERSKVQRITVTDTLAPILTEEAEDLVIRCTAGVSADLLLQEWLDSLNASFTDDCGIAGIFISDADAYDPEDAQSWPGSVTDTIDYTNCNTYGGDTVVIQEYDVVAFDGCENAVFSRARFVLLDQEAPELNCPGDLSISTLSGQCEGEFIFPTIDVTDACSNNNFDINVFIRNVDTIQTLRPDTLNYLLPKGVYEVNVSVQDCAGNSNSCAFTVEVEDQEQPVIDCPSDTSFVLPGTLCLDTFEFAEPLEVVDNCPLADTLNYLYRVINEDTLSGSWSSSEPMPKLLLKGGVNQIEYIVSDEAGNTGLCTYEVTIQDTTRPTAICQPNTIFANPSGAVFTRIDAALVDGGSFDNCKISRSYTIPQTVTCDQAGEQIDVLLIVQDEFGNSDTCSTILRVETQVLVPTYELDICDPDTLFLFADAPPPTSVYTYNWTGPNGFTSNAMNPIIPNVGPQNSGTYTLQIEGLNNCMASGSVSVNITDIATPDISADNEVNCEGNTVRLLSNSFSGPVTYQWYEGLPPGGVLLAETSQPVFDINPLPGPHDYYVIVVADSCTSNASDPVQVEIITQPEAILDTSYIQVCEGEAINLETVDQGTGYTYRWTGPNGFFSTLPNPPAIMNASQLNEGVYTLVVIAGDCESEPARLEVTVHEIPESPVLAPQDIYCVGENLTFEVTTPLDGDVYSFTDPGGTTYMSMSPQFNFGPISAQQAGLWAVNVERNNCQASQASQVLVQVEVLPTLDISSQGSFCEGDSIELSVQNVPGATYVWEGPVLSDTGRVIRFIPESGTYQLTLTSQNGCQTTASEDITINTPASITALSNSGAACIDPGTDIELVPTVFPMDDGSYTYQWRGPNGYQSSDSIGLILDADQGDNGYYTLTVFKDGCASQSDSTEVAVTLIPEQPIIEGATTVCEGSALELVVEDPGVGTQSFLWETPSGDTTTSTNSLVISDISSLGAGSYRVRSSVNGCESSLSAPFQVEVRPIPNQPRISGLAQYCEGDTLELYTNFENGLDYLWILPSGDTVLADTLRLLNLDQADGGDYRLLSVLDECNSPISAPYTISIQPIPQVPMIESFSDGICLLDDNIELELCLDPLSATTGASYRWYNADDRQALGAASGNLCFTVDSFESFEDGNNGIFVEAEVKGCVSATSIPVTIDMTLPATTEADAGLDFAICANEQAELIARQPAQGSGQWSVVLGGADLSDVNDPNPLVFDLSVGENIFAWTLSYDNCINYASDSVLVLFDEAPFPERDEYITPFNTRLEADILDNDLIVGPIRIRVGREPLHGTLQINLNDVTYFPDNGFIGTDSFTYTICSVNCPELCGEAVVKVQVGDESLCDIPTIFTPNNDGVNDFYTIQCLSSETYENNEVTIFNQYGDEVFHARPYKNDWQGTHNGEPLPVGTYFYIVDFGDGSSPQKGFLVLER